MSTRNKTEHQEENKEKKLSGDIKRDTLNKKVSFLSKYFCTVYKSLYILTLIIITIVLCMGTSRNATMSYYFTLAISLVLLYAIYIISKKLKTKRNKLDIKEIAVYKKIIAVVFSLLLMLVVVLTLALISVYVFGIL